MLQFLNSLFQFCLSLLTLFFHSIFISTTLISCLLQFSLQLCNLFLKRSDGLLGTSAFFFKSGNAFFEIIYLFLLLEGFILIFLFKSGPKTDNLLFLTRHFCIFLFQSALYSLQLASQSGDCFIQCCNFSSQSICFHAQFFIFFVSLFQPGLKISYDHSIAAILGSFFFFSLSCL